MKLPFHLSVLCFLTVQLTGQSISTINKELKSFTSEFITTLTEDQKTKTLFSFNDTMRLKWTNLPIGLAPRPGVAYGELSDKSRLILHRIFTTVLSSQGYLKLHGIMTLDDILNTLYKAEFDRGHIKEDFYKMIRNLNWDYGNYFISIYGTPDEKEPWAIKFGGHHIALNATITGNKISTSPLFFGTDPAEVKMDKYAGVRILSKEEDYGFMLLQMLSREQKSKAILSETAPGDIITSPGAPQRLSKYTGLPGALLTVEQKMMLEILIKEYVNNFDHAISHAVMEKIKKTGLNKVYFAWMGALENNKPHYYMVHGPDFLIEYDNSGFQNDGNHIHCILRQTGREFGEDILKQHYLEHKH